MNQLSFFLHGGKEQLFEMKLAPHLDILYKIAYRYTGSKADAEDLVQDLLTDLYANPHKMANIKKFKPWLIRCLYYRFIDNYRKQKHMANAETIDDPQITSLLSSQPDYDQQLMHQHVLASLQILSAPQRAVVCLHDMIGYTLPELAEMLDKPLGTLKSDLHRARIKLKKELKLQLSDRTLRHWL